MLIVKVYMIFICLIESTWDADFEHRKRKSKSFYFHRVLGVRKREISLPVGSKTAREKDLRLDEP